MRREPGIMKEKLFSVRKSKEKAKERFTARWSINVAMIISACHRERWS